MHIFVLCALLTASQHHAVCWRVRVPDATCDRLMHEWFLEAAIYYANNPDVVPMPALACAENGSLPPGARWFRPELPDMASASP